MTEMPDADRDEDRGDAEHGDDHQQESTATRSTAPQSEYTGRDVAIGAVVALVGVAVTFGVPLAVLL